jgi:sortase A
MVPNNTDPATWNQYHSAWSNYYQQYYQQYYSKTASQVVQKAQTQAQAKTKGALTVAMAAQAAAEQERKKTAELAEHLEKEHARISRPLTPAEQMRLKIREKASEQADKIRRSHHFIPLTIGATLLLTILFLQYNRNIIAPIVSYISPGNVSAVEIEAVDPTVTTNVGPEPKLIIPKLNIDVPVFFGIPNDKASIDNAMSRGIAHFAIPGANALPGQVGNVVLSGHSASDIYSDSPFKFIFSGLPRLAERDLIYINYESRRYTYVITGTVTVAPSDVDAILIDNGKPMVTLITCVPIGTANSRLLIFAEQINPDPAAAETPTPDPRPQVSQSEMPSNPPTFFEGLWNWLSGHGWNGDENWD